MTKKDFGILMGRVQEHKPSVLRETKTH